MKMKCFFAPDMRSALRMIRDEQGPDAVILSSRPAAGGIEVVAATDYDEALAAQALAAQAALALSNNEPTRLEALRATARSQTVDTNYVRGEATPDTIVQLGGNPVRAARQDAAPRTAPAGNFLESMVMPQHAAAQAAAAATAAAAAAPAATPRDSLVARAAKAVFKIGEAPTLAELAPMAANPQAIDRDAWIGHALSNEVLAELPETILGLTTRAKAPAVPAPAAHDFARGSADMLDTLSGALARQDADAAYRPVPSFAAQLAEATAIAPVPATQVVETPATAIALESPAVAVAIPVAAVPAPVAVAAAQPPVVARIADAVPAPIATLVAGHVPNDSVSADPLPAHPSAADNAPVALTPAQLGQAQRRQVAAANEDAAEAGFDAFEVPATALRLVASNPAEPADPAMAAMRDELARMRHMMEAQMEQLSLERLRGSPGRAAAFDALVSYGCDDVLAQAVASKLDARLSPDEIQVPMFAELSRLLITLPSEPLEDGGVIALVGPTGAGKTTTAAKLAARFAARHRARDVALVTTDCERPGAREQLHAHGRKLGITVCEAQGTDGLQAALEQLSDYPLVLVDTTGYAPRDRALFGQILWLRAARKVRSLLVLPANAHPQDLGEVIRRYRPAAPEGVILTKLDETGHLGSALSVAVRHGLPLAYTAHGQRVESDLAAADASGLAQALEKLRRAADNPFATENRHALA